LAHERARSCVRAERDEQQCYSAEVA
jgi:hypothetical protein